MKLGESPNGSTLHVYSSAKHRLRSGASWKIICVCRSWLIQNGPRVDIILRSMLLTPSSGKKKKLPRSWIYTSVSHHYGAEIEKGAWAGLHCDSCATLLGSACKEFCKPHLCQPTRCSTKRSERDAWWRKRVRAQLVRVPYCAQRCQFHGQCQWHSIRDAEYVVSCLVPARYPGRQLATCYQVNYAGNFQTDARTICARFFKRLTQFCDRNELWEAMHSRIQSLPR